MECESCESRNAQIYRSRISKVYVSNCQTAVLCELCCGISWIAVNSHPSHNIHTNESAVLSIFPLRSAQFSTAQWIVSISNDGDDDDGGGDKTTSLDENRRTHQQRCILSDNVMCNNN
jgi:hypothetical protein